MDKQKKCFGDGNEWMKWDDIISMAVRSYIRNFIEKTSFIRVLVVLNILFICCNSNIHAGYYWNEQMKRRRRRRKKCTRQKSHLSLEAKTPLCVCIMPRLDAWCACALAPSAKDKNAFTLSWMDANIRIFEWRHFKSEQVRVRWIHEWMNKPQKSAETNRFCYDSKGMYHFSISNNAIACPRVNGWKIYTGISEIFIFILCAHHIFPCNFLYYCSFIWHFGCVPNDNMLHAKFKTGWTKLGDLFE